MNHAEEIDAFIHQCFAIYGLNFKDFFYELVDDEEDEDGGDTRIELPIVVGGDINMELLSNAADALGLSTEALINMDQKAVRVWYDKYPYFELRKQFDKAREHSRVFFASPKEMFLACLFDENYHPDQYRRYKGDFKNRLLDLLKTYNTVMPGCYHENEKIAKLYVQTNNFTHFPKIKEMADSYLSMVSRARELFYKLWDEDLPEDEIREYNFLVSVLGMRDVGYSGSEPIYYKLARKFAPIYKQEEFTDYLSYIRYKYFETDFPAFYTCKEFYDYPELIERVVQEFPNVKAEIGQMAILAKNFLCSFVWSDEPMPTIDPLFDEKLVGMLRFFGDDSPSRYHRVYVPKTEEELHGDEKYIAICERLAAPASQGGLKISVPEYIQNNDEHKNIRRIIARVSGGRQNG